MLSTDGHTIVPAHGVQYSGPMAEHPFLEPAPETSMRVGRVAAPLRDQVLEIVRNAILYFRYKPGSA